MGVLEDIRAKAAASRKSICLPEALDERTLHAAEACAKAGFAPVVLVGDTEKIRAKAARCGADVSKARIRDPALDPDYDDIVDTLVELRKAKGMTREKAVEALKDEVMYGAMLVRTDRVDGYVSGAVHSTADTLRPALQVIKAAKGVKTVSAFFMMLLPDSCPYAATRKVLFYADSGLVQNPTAAELADIAVGTALSWKALIGTDPVVAFLSHSTNGSAKHADVDKVRDALRIAKELAPDIEMDGEMQADAALIKDIGARKAPGSSIPGRANVLVFPNLDAGNIAYKLTERIAGATAVGLLISGMAKPVNDLSRGCKAEDIVDAVAVTACQASAG